MDTNGNNQKNLTNSNGSDATFVVSPDDSKIIYRNEDTEIYSMNIDGSNQINLTNSTFAETAPCISPLGLKIAYVSKQHTYHEIYIMDIDGSSKKRLTTSSEGNKTNPVFQPFQQ